MSATTKRKMLKALCAHVLEEDLDLALRVMMDFAAVGLNKRNGTERPGGADVE